VPVEYVDIAPRDPRRFEEVITEAQAEQLRRTIEVGRELFEGRVVWNINSTAAGGGVAELLHSLIAYARGGGVDSRWVVIEGGAEFFGVTKRIHNHLHGSAGDGGPLGEEERLIYERVTSRNAGELAELIRPGDLVICHDPQTAGLVQPLLDAGARVVWRCHVGLDTPNELARGAWKFLLPYVEPAEVYIFSRRAFVWEDLDSAKIAIIAPSIDPFAPKNEPLAPDAVRAILRAAQLVEDREEGNPVFERQDGTPGRVDRYAALIEDERVRADTPLVVQVSRWDRLKDPLGVIEGFARHVAPRCEAHLMLAGPDVFAVADDPEGAEVLQEATDRWQSLEPDVRRRVHLARLPMDDAEENAAMVNALQRRANVIVQKSLAEGFGLTVAEAMWKGRPVVASRVGGIQDQIADGETGFLVDPPDLEAYGDVVVRLISDAALAERIGVQAQERVRADFLGPRHLAQYLELFERLMASEPAEIS
jgi:trehalose synthase